jgi:hypothetical protein
MIRLLAVFAVLLVLVMPVFALSVSGTWEAKVVVGGQSGSPTFDLKQNGEKLTGSYTGALGGAPVTGTLKGDRIVLEFMASGLKVTYSGKIATDGKTMEGTVDYGGQANGTFTAAKKSAKGEK